MSQTCGNCKYFYCEGDGRCCVQDETWVYADDDVCDKFENQDKYAGTLFRQITESPEVLAPKFVYRVTSFLDGLDKPKKIWYSTLINNQYFNTELEAKRATVAKLKEVEE